MEDAKNSSAVREDSESGLFHMQHHGTMLHVDEATNQREEYWENLRPGNRVGVWMHRPTSLNCGTLPPTGFCVTHKRSCYSVDTGLDSPV